MSLKMSFINFIHKYSYLTFLQLKLILLLFNRKEITSVLQFCTAISNAVF